MSNPVDNIATFKLLFRGRQDIYAVRWEKDGKSGYMPAYKVDWSDYNMYKSKGGTFKDYSKKEYQPLNDEALLRHFQGSETIGLGILAEVNLHNSKKGDFIEIIVEPYPYPVNYKGQYHYRSGSTKQELKGAALDKFLLQKIGKRWDGVPIPRVTVKDLKQQTFDFFRKQALKSQRIYEESLTDSNEHLLENLQLKEGEYLKRAAILLFHSAPENFVTGSYIKIGYFQTDDDLKFQDEIHGNLFEQIEKTIELLFAKYIKAEISYEGITRVEKYEYP